MTIWESIIDMGTSDAFALQKSGLNAFLFAEVGTELNGSPLTILSVLARLGQDPWSEAAKWAKLPRSTIVDRLTQSISQMPLSPQALGEARNTASRLILLLPTQVSRPASEAPAVSLAAKLPVPKWALVAICAAAVALGLSFNYMSGPSTGTTITPIGDIDPPAAKAPSK